MDSSILQDSQSNAPAKPVQREHSECMGILRPIRDALDVLNGKWKLPIIVALTFGEKRFGEISREVHGITDRVLSKELQDLVMNGLVKRTVTDTFPVKVTYALTPHSESLQEVIDSLRKWGVLHRTYLQNEDRKAS
ncbi:winged helix-turn-helix transcriptional regulator [Larkinella bovis]|uniref:Winged helix-turn-helix transcriptional regulator n=1 Tax=Larkinella bovis TaxID=683041 RepID=A0ABW0I385_9BACT